MYAPPPGPPPGQTSGGAPSYAPPAGSPPHEPSPAYAPPPNPPPDITQHSALLPSHDLATPSEPPPPYTASTSPPSWSAPSSQLQDLTLSTPSLALTHLPLDPPPAFFSSPTPLRIRTRSFAPFTIPSRTRTLTDGFALLYHPELSAHGVPSADWTRFLLDLGVVARLASQGLDLRGDRPRAPGPRGGSTRGRAYDQLFVKSPLEQVQSLVGVYNESAWERRKVRVTVKMRAEVGGREGYELFVEAL